MTEPNLIVFLDVKTSPEISEDHAEFLARAAYRDLKA
jgi:hypothetical protein